MNAGPPRPARRMLACAALACGVMQIARADLTLTTPGFIVRIDVQCEEGHVSCDRVSYLGTNRRSGKKLALTGETVHTRCVDDSPCRFLGYRFRNGRYTYFVGEEGSLTVTRDERVLTQESGEWQD
jgi:hypothetical protein